jgi:hypothetical protein
MKHLIWLIASCVIMTLASLSENRTGTMLAAYIAGICSMKSIVEYKRSIGR